MPSVIAARSGSEVELLARLASIDGLDLDQALHNCRCPPERYFSILKQFAELHRRDVDRVREFVAVGSANEARIIAHTLKGVTGTLGLTRLQEMASLLDSALRQSAGSAKISPLIERLGRELHEIDVRLAAIRLAESPLSLHRPNHPPASSKDRRHGRWPAQGAGAFSKAGSQKPASIIVVDDSPENLRILGDLLLPSYGVRTAKSGRVLFELLARDQPDLILLDVVMPGMDGYAVLQQLKSNPATAGIPVIFLTAMDSTAEEEMGLELGAADYIAKPIRPAIVLARVRAHVEIKQARDRLKDQNAALEAEVSRRMEENQIIRDVSIRALGSLAEIRDPETGAHILRTQEYVRILACHLQADPRFSAELPDNVIELMARTAPLHDIGKVGIPDHILLKPGKFTPEEWEIMKTHASIGAEAIERAERGTSRPIPFLKLAKEIARCHHEKWDGSGYPGGLAGNAIPISARLMALADVFDALISARVYKPGMPMEDARAIIVKGRGSHFDPDVVDAFVLNFDRFRDTALRYRDAAT